MSEPKFIHLQLHSEHAIQDGLVRVNALMQTLKMQCSGAVAVTDLNNLFAAVRFYKAATRAGIKPIFGCDLTIRDEEGEPSTLTLLCQNQTGYANLTRLISRAYVEGQAAGTPGIEFAWLQESHEGLIALSGGQQGVLGYTSLADMKRRAECYKKLFADRFYLSLSRVGRRGEQTYGECITQIASELKLPIVATNEVRFLTREDFEAHEARVCIYRGDLLGDPKRTKDYTPEQYLRSPEEMVELFSDMPQALQNSVEIAKRCNVHLTLGKNYLPAFPTEDNLSEHEYLTKISEEGLARRLKTLFKTEEAIASKRAEYDARLKTELGVIDAMGYPGYFLIVADFIRWSKTHDIPVGPGRGSGAGSLVAYVLDITDLDPLQYDLLFERFLNPERVSMPDFDIDFCMAGRDRVIEYVADHYGRDCVSQIITFGTMAAKAAVRDVGRVLGHPYGFVDRIAKLIPFELGITLDKALDQEEALLTLYHEDEEVTALIDLAKKLEGVVRNAGKHAGGVVIAPSALTDFTPLYCEADGSSAVSQFDKDDVEAAGLVKFDFLGLRTLTIIKWAVDTINARPEQQQAQIDITQIPLDDAATFELLKACQTTAVFQLESRGMKDLIKRLQPDCFEEIIALVALFRPGPLQSGMVDDFIDRKHGRAVVEYPHPDLEAILKPTYGVILYQEQVMQIAQVLAGYSLGGADLLRRAMGKKKAEEMAKQREIFTTGAVERGVKESTATYIFDLMEKFAGYGFNKSHSAAYALLSYQTAWLKAHYPSEFMAAVLSSDMDNTDKIVEFYEDCKQLNLPVDPPSINKSFYRFTVRYDEDMPAIVYGLGAVKGVGENAVNDLIEARAEGGPFTDLFDVCGRASKKSNKRVLEALVKSGAMDDLHAHRSILFKSLPIAIQFADKQMRDESIGQIDMFGESIPTPDYAKAEPWTLTQCLRAEKESLGLYLSGHPIDPFLPELKHYTTARIASLQPSDGQTVRIAGLIVNMRTLMTKRGDRMAFVALDDKSGRMEVAVFSEAFQQHRALLAKDQLIVLEGKVSVDTYSGGYKMSADEMWSFEDARASFAKQLNLKIHADQINTPDFSDTLKTLLTPFKPGHCRVQVHYDGEFASGAFGLGEEWRVKPHDDLLMQLRSWLGEEKVTVAF